MKAWPTATLPFLVMQGLVRDRDRLDVEIAEKRFQLYELQAGDTPAEGSSTLPEGESVLESPNVEGPLRLEVQTVGAVPRAKKGWYYVREEDGISQILAFANHKGSCSVRRYKAQNGKALRRRPNHRGDYQDAFDHYLTGAVPLRLSKQPNLVHDCKRQLPAWVLAEFQPQIKSHS